MCDHFGKLPENFGVCRFQLASTSGGVCYPFTRQHRNGFAVVTHRDGQHVCWTTNCLHKYFALRNFAAFIATLQQNFFRIACPRIYVVLVIQRLTSCSANLSGNQPRVITNWQIQQHVCETEVGQHSPLRDQRPQMVHRIGFQFGVFVGEFCKRRHSVKLFCPMQGGQIRPEQRAP